ncbi:MAG: efflux RND transporter periplasmic adaptor subunit [Fibrobacterales bacterium]
MKVMRVIIPIVSCVLIMVGCEKAPVDDKPNMTELQAQKGVPVTVDVVASGKISKISKYSGDVEGARQKNIYAVLPEYIQKISVAIGDYVKKDQVLAILDDQGVTPKYRQAQVQFNISEKSYNRLKRVYEKGGVSKQKLDEVEANYLAAKANFDSMRKARNVLAPFNGVITDIFFKEGTVAITGKDEYPMMKIAQINTMLLKVNVSSQEIHKFKKGLNAFVEMADKKIWGHVEKVPLAANPMTRFFNVEIRFNNKEKSLKPGMYVKANVITNEQEGKYIPIASLRYDKEKPYVYVVKNGVAKKQLVKVLLENDDHASIKTGVAEGDFVVTTGATRLSDGVKVLMTNQITGAQ